jgi:hypothetical protein
VLERRVAVDLRERDLRHDGVLGERRRAHEMAHRLAVARQPGRPVGEVALVLLLTDREAEIRPRAQAVDALAALRREERDDVISGLHRRDIGADPLDDAGAFVAEHGRRVPGRIGARRGVEIGVADPAGDEPHEHLARPRPGEVDLLHDQWLAELLEDSGAHLHARNSTKSALPTLSRRGAQRVGREQ